MNFFEHQDHARKQSRWLILAFILSILAVIVAIDAILLLVLGTTSPASGEWAPFTAESLDRNLSLLVGGGIATATVIGLASLYKTVKLRSGGGQVARELGGTLLESDPADPLRRRLRNVVEEIALASGVPVPEIYLLEKEAGINAFAAGFSPADAAIAITRGTLEGLDRDELQGVIAHEFSHILNGDMRINIRLMGALFGILILALAGRRVLMHARHLGRSRDKGGMAVILIAFGLMLVGYVGQFCGSWIKAAVSRQREFLADASAVQFTRDPEGIGGALKKIAVYNHGSHLVVDAEEVTHMLFGDSRKMRLFSTHPPLVERIRRIQPGFDPSELERLAAEMARDHFRQANERESDAAAKVAARSSERKGWEIGGGLIQKIGQPGFEQFMLAATLAASLPEHVRKAAQTPEWAPEVLFYTLLDSNREVCERQLLMVAQRMGSESEGKARALLDVGGVPGADQRLPLFELAFPALKRQPLALVTRVLATVRELVRLDDRIEVFEYLLAELISQHLWEAQNPPISRMAGNLELRTCLPAARRMISIFASQGQMPVTNKEAAFRIGIENLADASDLSMPEVEDWARVFAEDLPHLNKLTPKAKQTLVAALIATVTHDGRAEYQELELLRVCCSLIHVPLPIMEGEIRV